MSFDVFLERFVGGESVEVDRDRVRAVLRSTRFDGPDPFGFYIVYFPDGAHVEFSAEGLDGSASFTGCAFHIREISDYLVKFIFDVAKAGDMIIMAPIEGPLPILTSPDQRRELPTGRIPEDEVDPAVCESPRELAVMLSGGYQKWRDYRDHISGDPG